jgi:hypothetical protein
MTPEQMKEKMAEMRAMRGKNKVAKESSPKVARQEAAPVVEPSTVTEALRDSAEAGVVTPEQGKPETIPPNLFSGFTKRLEYFGEHPGFMRWWCNDDKGGTTIANAIKSGWTFVERTDVQLNAAVTPRNNDLGSHIRQYVGTDEAGGPMYAYLLEKPEWLWKLHEYGPGSREEYHKKLEQQIRSGTIGMKAGEKRYTATNPYPGGGQTGLPAIVIDSKITR